MIDVIEPEWPAPPQVRAFCTTRSGGVSRNAYASMNVATHVGDNEAVVMTNRTCLSTQFCLPNEPCWLQQVHGNTVVAAQYYPEPPIADASYTSTYNQICAILTADCLPLLICDQQGTQVAAIHAGWRGLAAGIISQTLAHFTQPKDKLLVWLGPAIGPAAFEVGAEVHAAFLNLDNNTENAFTPSYRPNHWYADIYQLAAFQLHQQGITKIYGGSYCTYSEEQLFYSYRRDGEKTGRMASLIWLDKN